MGSALRAPSHVSAQDDWGVRRTPFDAGLVRRYKSILNRRPSDAQALGKLMALYRRYRSLELLVGEMEKDSRKQPSFSHFMVLAYLEQSQNNADKALSWFTQAAEKNPKSPRVHEELAKLLRARGNAQAAREHYAQALHLSATKKQKTRILHALAELSMDARDIDATKAYLERLLAIDPKNTDTRIELADALAAHKRYDEAIEIFRKAEAGAHSDPILRVALITKIGRALEGKGDGMAAVFEYERGIKIGRRGYYTTKELTSRIISIYRKRQQLQVLISKLEKRWVPRQRSFYQWDTLARLFEETGKADKAIMAFQKALAKAPYELDTQRRLIALLENSGRPGEAISQYERVIKVAPGDARFQLELARRFAKLGQSKKALAMAKKIQSRFGSDAGVLSALADLYNAWQRPEDALATYQRLVRLEPRDPSHLENLGEHYFQSGFKDKAYQVWKKIIRIKSTENYAKLANIFAEHDLLPESLKMYGKAIALQSKDAKLYRERANVRERIKSVDKAIQDWKMVIKLSPDKRRYASARQEARRRVVHLLSRRRPSRLYPQRSLASQTAAWKAGFYGTPRRIGDGFYLVEVYRSQGQTKEQQKTLEALLKLRPGNTALTLQLVASYRTNQEHEKAITLLLNLAKSSPGRESDYYNQIAEIKTDQRLDSEALDYVRRALEKSPNDPIAYQRLAERYQAMQRQLQAISAYEKVLELSPRNFPVYFTLARLYVDRGLRDQAMALYQTVLMSARKSEVIAKAGRAAVELAWLSDSLAKLLRTVAPLTASMTHKTIYRDILVQIYDHYVPELAAHLEDSDKTVRQEARTKLDKLGALGLRPLLQALADESNPHQQQISISVLGYLGNTAAAPPLIHIAQHGLRQRSRGLESGLVRSSGTSRNAPKVPIPLVADRPIDWEVRVAALITAARLGYEGTVSPLASLASSKVLSIRQAAIFGLGIAGTPRALPALLQASKSTRHSMQTLACLAFSGFRDTQSIEKSSAIAITMLSNTRMHPMTRAACAWLLGIRRARSGQAALERALAWGNDETQRIAAWALGELGDRAAVPSLLQAFATSQEPVRSAAIRSLEKLLGEQPAESTEVLDNVYKLSYTIYPIGSTKFDEASTIRNLLHSSPVTRFPAALLIGQEAHLASGLRTAITQDRDLVLRILRDMDQDEQGISLGILSAHQQLESSSEQAAIAQTLFALGKNLSPQLESLAAHRDPDVRMRAVSLLTKLGGTGARDFLIAGLSDPDTKVRRGAMRSSVRFAVGSPEPSSPLAHLIERRLASASDWRERVSAAKALGRWPAEANDNQAITGALIKALKEDATGFVRAASASGLAFRCRIKAQGEDHRDPRLLGALDRASNERWESLPVVRVHAVKALQTMGSDEARKILKRVAEADSNKAVRDAASQI